MRAVRPIAKSRAVVITIFLIATAPLQYALGGEASQDRFVIAQTSMGSPDLIPPPAAPSAPSAPPAPRMDSIPPGLAPRQAAPSQPNTLSDLSWGAIGFTADGSYSSVWKTASQAEAEAKVAKKCAEYGRGGCQVVSFSGQECVALATFIGSYKRRRWSLSFTAGGMTYPEAQSAAMGRCNSDERSQGRCQPRTAACADGR
jgi:Domain of unknown function (DUF4189)